MKLDMIKNMTKNKNGDYLKKYSGGFHYYEIVNACKFCGKPYLKLKTRSTNIYCSNKCSQKDLTTKERTDKMRACRKSYPTGKDNPMFGLFGKNHPCWKGEKLSIEYRERHRIIQGYNEWKKQVKVRDNYTCQCCFKRGGYIVSHHIESFNNCPELRTELSNGITLCNECHNNFHHQFGKGGNTAEQINEFKQKGEGATEYSIALSA